MLAKASGFLASATGTIVGPAAEAGVIVVTVVVRVQANVAALSVASAASARWRASRDKGEAPEGDFIEA